MFTYVVLQSITRAIGNFGHVTRAKPELAPPPNFPTTPTGGLTVAYLRALGDGTRHFEPWSSDEDDTSALIPSLNFHTKPMSGCLRVDIFNVHRPPLHGGSSMVHGLSS
ncbi:hypothetical protein TNCV_2676741 [Trichonephila clavipes]|nr:hypothetical protein TNCV_2676741 [Trichonephila clavipes]